MTAQSNYLAGKRTEIHPYKTREGGATVTVFVPYNCLNNCPFCINKAEYENPEGWLNTLECFDLLVGMSHSLYEAV